MLQIAYFSTASASQDAKTVNSVLISSRCNNRRDEITGLLVAGGNRYLQVIEGPSAAMKRLYATIRCDRRHLALTTLVEQTTHQRCFEGWSMAFRREPALGQFDSFPEIVRYLTEQVEDRRLRGQIRNFARIFIAQPPAVGAIPWKLSA
ncbi:MAG: BLUF domain-containing protein [Sphingomicrobium sp.]